MSYDYQLIEYLKPKKKGFLGIFAADTLPVNPPSGSSLIVNYSKQHQEGSHWVAMDNLNTNNVLFFDSFGYDADEDDLILSVHTNFKKYLLKNSLNKNYTHNEYNLQHIESDVCGQWCCKFILDGLPANRQGTINPKWKKYVQVNSPEEADKLIRKEIKLSK